MIRETLHTFIIKFEGVCDFDAIYKFLFDWFFEHGYDFVEEKEYKSKTVGKGLEQEITVVGEKKVTGMYKYEIAVAIHTWDMHDVEVLVEGKKRKLTYLRIELKMTPTFVLDYRGRFDKSKFLKKMLEFYRNTLRRDEIELIEDDLYYETVHFHDAIKKLFDLQSKWGAY